MTDEGPVARQARLLTEELTSATFQERGVAVPFTTPLLSQARMRRDQNDRLECMVPNFTAGKGIYVTSLKGLREAMVLTLHDRLLMEALAELPRQSPEQVRRAALAVLASGVCGPDAATAGQKLMDQDAHYLVLTQFTLVTDLLKLAGIDAADLRRPGMSVEDSQRLAHQALAKVAASVGITGEQMTARVDALGEVLAPAGLPQAPAPGRLRRLARRLERFAQAMETWADHDPSDAAPLGGYAATVATHTLSLVDKRLSQLDALCADIRVIAADVPRQQAEIAAVIDRLAWLLDGWDFIMTLWDSVAEADAATRQTTMTDISRLLPLVPREEVGHTLPGIDMDAINRLQRRWVRVNQDWRTGILDMEAVMRLETVNAAMGA